MLLTYNARCGNSMQRPIRPGCFSDQDDTRMSFRGTAVDVDGLVFGPCHLSCSFRYGTGVAESYLKGQKQNLAGTEVKKIPSTLTERG